MNKGGWGGGAWAPNQTHHSGDVAVAAPQPNSPFENILFIVLILILWYTQFTWYYIK